MQGTWVGSLVWEDFRFPWWISSKESTWNEGSSGNMGSIPGSGRSPGGGHSNPLQCCLENPMDRGVWQAIVSRVAELDVTNSFADKESTCKTGDTGNTGSIPVSWRSPAEGNGNPLQYSSLKNLMYRGTWRATVQLVTKSQTQLTKHDWIDLARMHEWKIPHAAE